MSLSPKYSASATLTGLSGGTLVLDGISSTLAATLAPFYRGDDGEGVPIGGTTGQVLAKASATDYDTEWVDQSGGAHPDGPYIILLSGQSNAAGSYPDGYDEGPNPASSLVSVWDNVTGDYGSSDWTQLPLTRTAPNGNGGKNNYALARAHRIADETGRSVVVVFYATGGRDIESWTDPASLTDMWTGMKAAVEAALIATGRTTIDEMVWAQGEANFEDSFETFLPKLTELFDRFDGETWFTKQTPTYFMGPSPLHDRYQWQAAAQAYCSRINNRVQFVPANLPNSTEFEETGAGDNTHLLGWALWQQGYFGIVASARFQSPVDTIFYERGVGPWRYGARQALMMASSLTSLGSVDFTTGSTPNSDHNSSDSIAWGDQCETFGTGSFAFGSLCNTASAAAYSFVAGQNVQASIGRSAGFGRDNNLDVLYAFAAGRGHTVVDSHGAAVGSFSEYTTAEADEVRFQVGIGSSTSARDNGFAVRESGILEAKNLPTYADDASAISGGMEIGQIYKTANGELRIVDASGGGGGSSPSPTIPAFIDVTDAAVDTLIESNTVVVAGDADTVWPAVVRGDGSPEMQVNAGTWGPSGIFRVGDSLKLRLTSAATGEVSSSANLYAQGVASPWIVTTTAGSPFDTLLATLLSGAAQVIAHPLLDGSMFQDRAGTIPVTASGQLIGRVLDAGGGDYHATAISDAARGVFRDVDGIRYIEYNGVNTAYSTPAIAAPGVDKAQLFAGVRKLTDAASGMLLEMSVIANSNFGSFYITLPESTSRRVGVFVRSNGSVFGFNASSTLLSPTTNILTAHLSCTATTATDAINLSVDGASFPLTYQLDETPTTGNFNPTGTYPLYYGAREGTSVFFSGRSYATLGPITRFSATNATAAQIEAAEAYYTARVI